MKELLSEDILVNVDLSPTDLAPLSLFFFLLVLFCSSVYLFYLLKDEAMILLFGRCYSYEVKGREATGVIKEKKVSQSAN